MSTWQIGTNWRRWRRRAMLRRLFDPLTLSLLAVVALFLLSPVHQSMPHAAILPIVHDGADSYADAPASCTEARAMGLSSMRRGEPGSAPWLDTDHDGIACEPWHGSRA